jgi:hypothetical protein
MDTAINPTRTSLVATLALVAFATACTPTVQVQAPDKPIEINLNVKIEHHIKIEMEKDIRQSIKKNPDIF